MNNDDIDNNNLNDSRDSDNSGSDNLKSIIAFIVVLIYVYFLCSYSYIVAKVSKSKVVKLILYTSIFMSISIILMFLFRYRAHPGIFTTPISYYWFGHLANNYTIDPDYITEANFHHFLWVLGFNSVFPILVNMYNSIVKNRSSVKLSDALHPFKSVDYYNNYLKRMGNSGYVGRHYAK